LFFTLQERGGAQQPADRDEPEYSRGAGGSRQGRERERSPTGDRDRRGGSGRDSGRDDRGR
jgi:hypothetical protein